MPTYSSDSEDARAPPPPLFGRQKALHKLLGGGKVADVLLWRNKNLSAAILSGVTAVWFLFEVLQYNVITLACHVSITMMLIVFLWSTGADLINWSPPDPRAITIPESTLRWLLVKLNRSLLKFYEISSGKDLKTFFIAVGFLWMLSGIGNYFSSISLLYTCFLCTMILPTLYEQYQDEVDYLARKGNRDMRKMYKKFDSKFLTKIPRGPVKEKKEF